GIDKAARARAVSGASMRPHLPILAVTLSLAAGFAGAAPPPLDLAAWPRPPVRAEDPELEARISALLARMSLEEKIGQVIQAAISAVTPEDGRRFHLGSVLNGGNSGPDGDDRAPAQAWLALADAFWLASTDDRDGGV